VTIRRTSLRIALLVFAMAAFVPLAAAQRHISIPPERLVETETGDRAHISINTDANERERLREMLLEWKQFVQEGNTADATDILSQMREILSQDGLNDRDTLLSGFVAIGHEWAQTETWDPADRAYKAALELDPDYAPAFLGQAELARKRDGGFAGYLSMAAGVVQALKARLADALGLLGLLANVGFLAVLAVAATTAGIGLVVLVKHVALLRHGVHEVLTDRMPDGIDKVIGWVVAFLPVIIWLSPPWWVIYWIVVLSGYGNTRLRRLSVAALVVIVLLPGAFYCVSVLSSLQEDPVVQAYTALQRRDVTAKNLSDVARLAQETKSGAAYFLLGRLQTAARKPDDAVAAYNSAVSAAPDDVRAIVNRGNIHFRASDLASAITEYKVAVDRDKNFALAWRNGSIAYAQNLQADTASEWLTTAQRLDRSSVQDWSERWGADHVVDADLSAREISDLVRTSRPEIAAGLKRSLLNPVSIGAFVGIILVLLRYRRGMGALEAAACEKCGRAFCSRCHAAGKNTTYCTQCVHLYIKKDGVSPVVRTAKLREVERHVQITSVAIRLFNLLLPGAGSLYADRYMVGTIVLFSWAFALGALLLPAHILMDPSRLGHADLLIVFWVELAALVAVYLVALVQSLRHSG
jgi:tetratricopeptide (TPR) repeat protein